MLRANNPNKEKDFVTKTATRNNTTTAVDGHLRSTNPSAYMNVSSQSREEATDMTWKTLNTAKTKIHIGSWNVRTMYAAGKLAQITTEMNRYKLEILGVSESRWTKSGRITTASGETILYSGREDDIHEQGVAIILKKGLEKTLMEWKPINSRLMSVRLRGKQINISLFQCYAPTNEADEESKDAFYDQLQKEIDKTPNHDIKIIMGDLNSKVGCDNTGYERTMGQQGCGRMNENGERLVEFCSTNNLVIGGTLFPHKDIHKLTWYSPNLRDKNQIDHFIINNTWRRSLLDVRVKRGADIGSDHQLVTAELKLKLRSTGRKVKSRKRFDIEKLKDIKVKRDFTIKLQNRFQLLQNLDEETIDAKWKNISTIIKENSVECLGYKQKIKKKDFITPETWDKIEVRRKAKKKVNDAHSTRLKEKFQKEYNEVHKDVKKHIRKDRRNYIDNLAEKAVEAGNKMEQGTLYRITKEICGKKQATYQHSNKR